MTAPVDSIPRRSSSESTSVITPVSSSGPGLSVTGSTPTTPGQSFSRKLGGFFGGRGQSVTSITSVTSYTESAHPPTTHGQQEPIANGLGSDDEGETGEERERGMQTPVPLPQEAQERESGTQTPVPLPQEAGERDSGM